MQPKLYPRLMLALLTGLNILNYIDRSVLFAVQPLIKSEFHVTDAEIGWLTSMFLYCYMIAGPFVGWMGDRFPRKYIVSIGIMVWSGLPGSRTPITSCCSGTLSSVLERQATPRLLPL